MDDRKIFGVRRNIFALSLVSFFNDISAEMVQAVMPVFLTSVLGASAFLVGLIEGVADALASVLKLLSGWMSDRAGRRKLPAVLGYAISVSARFFLAAVQTFSQVFTLRVVDRIGKGIRDAPRDALIAESVPREELGRSYGFHRAADTLGATLGPLLAFFLLPILGGNYRSLFLIAFVFGLFAIGSFVFVKDRRISGAIRGPVRRLDWGVFHNHRKFMYTVGSIFIFGLGALPVSLVLLKAKEVGSVANVPLMYFVYSLSFVVASVPLGRLADRIGERMVITGGFAAAVLSYIGMIFSSNIFLLAAFFSLLGVYFAATDGMQRMLAAKSLPDGLLATGQGFLNMALGFSSLGAGLIGGFLWSWADSSAAFAYAAALSFIGGILFWLTSASSDRETT